VVTRRGRRVIALAAVLAVGSAGVVWARAARARRAAAGPPCLATVGTTSYGLDLEQAANATTVAAVGKRMGLPDHAVTVALAAALQESGLHDLTHGDLDSVGLFQQRPSEGWGTAAQILVPRYAATAFFEHLERVPGWGTMAVTDAAQAVQRSAAPQAYAAWEAEARALAIVLTGESAHGMACRFTRPTAPAPAAQLAQAMALELGSPATGTTVSAARGWTVASWLVGHAQRYGVTAVSFAGWRWAPGQRSWQPEPGASQRVDYATAAVA